MPASRLRFFPLATLVATLGLPLPSVSAQTAPAPETSAPATPVASAAAAPNAAPAPVSAPPPPVQDSTTAPNAPGSPNEPASNPNAPAVAPEPSPVEPASSAAPATPSTTPPPYPQAVEEPPPSAATAKPSIHEPPLPQAYRSRESGTPLPPPVPQHVAPRASLWAGVRPTVLMPLGSMWTDREPDDYYCCTQNPRPFSEFASPGPGLGIDVGARFGRHYQVFALGEYSFLGSGPLGGEFGGQESVTTSLFGAGVRFSTHPDSIGFLIELSLGYRFFEAKWRDGTTLTANDDLFSTRLGIGAIWQLNPTTSVEFLMVLGGGAFTDIEWTFANGDQASALSGYDDRGQYIPVGFQLGIHWDIISSKD